MSEPKCPYKAPIEQPLPKWPAEELDGKMGGTAPYYRDAKGDVCYVIICLSVAVGVVALAMILLK